MDTFLRRKGEHEVAGQGLPVLEEPFGNQHAVADDQASVNP
ncbi:MAG TPA: hypothetical protein VEI04_12270 [Syntrophobacteria bacterium]|nr:hypothetical protein [Syntrophobacteria bacterium]